MWLICHKTKNLNHLKHGGLWRVAAVGGRALARWKGGVKWRSLKLHLKWLCPLLSPLRTDWMSCLWSGHLLSDLVRRHNFISLDCFRTPQKELRRSWPQSDVFNSAADVLCSSAHWYTAVLPLIPCFLLLFQSAQSAVLRPHLGFEGSDSGAARTQTAAREREKGGSGGGVTVGQNEKPDRRKKGEGKKEKKNKDERKRARCGWLGALLQPAHLLLFTIEEIEPRWKRGRWPRDKNHCSTKLETGRTVGKAQIKNALPTWSQYTAALIWHWKPKTQQHYFTVANKKRPQFAQRRHVAPQRRPEWWSMQCCRVYSEWAGVFIFCFLNELYSLFSVATVDA